MTVRDDYNTLEELGILKIACENSLKAYIKVMHHYNVGNPFTFKHFHNDIISHLENRVNYKTTKNLLINMPVGFGKTALIEYFISWCFAKNKNYTFLYTSYSDDLVTKHSSEIMEQMKSETYSTFWQYDFKKSKQSKSNWSIEGSTGRSGLTAGAMGGTITGLDAGNPAIEGFCGAMICFPYNQKIATNKGFIKIGDIVENKLDVLVYSYNFDAQKIELQPIEKYIKNPYKPLVEVSYEGAKFICTCDHKVYTKNRGYIEAINLLPSDILMSNSFDLPQGDSEVIGNSFPAIISIKNKINFFFSKFSRCFRFVISKTFCSLFPIISTLNANNRCRVNVKILGNFADFSFILSNFPSNFWCQFSPWAVYSKWKSAMSDSVLHIFSLSAIRKIFKSIVNWISIQMPTFYSLFLFTYKCTQNTLMYTKGICFTIFPQLYSKMSTFFFNRFKHFPLNSTKFFNSIVKIFPCFTPNIANIRSTIQSFKAVNWFKNFFTHTYPSTYCVSVRSNHNIFAGESKAILVKNCDDPIKATDIIFETKRQDCIYKYNSALKTRLRRSDVPIILIMQRLQEDDLSGWILENEPDKWDVIKIRALEDEKSIWEEKVSTAELLDKRDKTPFVFYPQYQQEPNSNINSSFKGLTFAEKEEEKNIFNGFSHTDKGFDGSDGTAFTIINKVGETYYVFGKLWQEKHVDDCLNEMSFYRQKYMSGMNYTEKNDDKGYMGRNFPNTSTYQETQNKHFKIMTYLYPAWKNIKFIEGTDEAYIRQIQSYNEHAKHDDAPDSLASAIRLFETRTKVIGMRPF